EGHFMRHSYGGYPVVEDGRVLGFLSRAEVKRIEAAAWDGVRVREAMVPIDELPAAAPEEPVGDLLERMAGSDVGRLPVLERGRLVGLISQTDIMRHLAWSEQGQGKGFLG
ncbi:MAG: CBS domain-containing protein, partial [Candidatus Sericytochromatia bacterium]